MLLGQFTERGRFRFTAGVSQNRSDDAPEVPLHSSVIGVRRADAVRQETALIILCGSSTPPPFTRRMLCSAILACYS
jgi:hypothetical protein